MHHNAMLDFHKHVGGLFSGISQMILLHEARPQ